MIKESLKKGTYLKPDCPRVPLSRFMKVPFVLLTEGSEFHTRNCQLFPRPA